jgi:DNA helicase II / ATP-dependent DNA helicase PcrA
MTQNSKAKNEEEEIPEFEQGEQVEHPKWGIGTIIIKQGAGPNQKLQILFPEEGQKKVMAKYAGLKKVM